MSVEQENVFAADEAHLLDELRDIGRLGTHNRRTETDEVIFTQLEWAHFPYFRQVTLARSLDDTSLNRMGDRFCVACL